MSHVGAGLLANADLQATLLLNMKPLSRASPLPHLLFVVLNIVLLLSLQAL